MSIRLSVLFALKERYVCCSTAVEDSLWAAVSTSPGGDFEGDDFRDVLAFDGFLKDFVWVADDLVRDCALVDEVVELLWNPESILVLYVHRLEMHLFTRGRTNDWVSTRFRANGWDSDWGSIKLIKYWVFSSSAERNQALCVDCRAVGYRRHADYAILPVLSWKFAAGT